MVIFSSISVPSDGVPRDGFSVGTEANVTLSSIYSTSIPSLLTETKFLIL